jgi:hypothetical protein
MEVAIIFQLYSPAPAGKLLDLVNELNRRQLKPQADRWHILPHILPGGNCEAGFSFVALECYWASRSAQNVLDESLERSRGVTSKLNRLADS